jgi:hypothetical protein
MDMGVVKAPSIQNANVVGPQLMKSRSGGTLQHDYQRRQRLGLAITGLAHDAQAAILGQWAAGPAVCNVRF